MLIRRDLYIMKATGIVRRIDDLGRVVIPKEIRRTMRIREGDPLEIYTDREGGVIFKKYSPVADISTYAADVCTSLHSVSGLFCAVCDCDSVIAFSGSGKKDVLDKSISDELDELIESRKSYLSDLAELPLTSEKGSPMISALSPIISNGDLLGAIVFLHSADRQAGESEAKLLLAASTFISKQLE